MDTADAAGEGKVDATKLNSAVATLRKAAESIQHLDLVGVQVDARLYGTGLSASGQVSDSVVERREEVRAAIEDLARQAQGLLKAHRRLEDLLG